MHIRLKNKILCDSKVYNTTFSYIFNRYNMANMKLIKYFIY